MDGIGLAAGTSHLGPCDVWMGCMVGILQTHISEARCGAPGLVLVRCGPPATRPQALIVDVIYTCDLSSTLILNGMSFRLEDVFVTEGVPQFTFVPPPNFNEVFLDIRKPTKPVIIEGQSGTGKTTCVLKALERLGIGFSVTKLTPRNASDVRIVERIVREKLVGIFLIDDFHRLDVDLQRGIGDLAKQAAENANPAIEFPKLIIVGINQVGSELIHLVPDVAKRLGIHRIDAGSEADIESLISEGCRRLNVEIPDWKVLFEESKGDFWLTQQLCFTLCAAQNILETQADPFLIDINLQTLRSRVISKLRASYHDGIKEFARGQRFRPSNDPYYKVLRAISQQDSSLVDLTELANANADVKGSINNIKERRLTLLLTGKQECARLFYYNAETKNFAIEDPALFYYMKHLDWDALRRDCGFRDGVKDFEYDFAFSFAGENRELVRCVYENAELLDAGVFFDELFEDNFLGKTWSKEFKSVFGDRSRLVVCFLDKRYAEKIWPLFEKDCFAPRVAEQEVIPIYLDDTPFVGIPSDINGIRFKFDPSDADWKAKAIDEIVFPIMNRLSA